MSARRPAQQQRRSTLNDISMVGFHVRTEREEAARLKSSTGELGGLLPFGAREGDASAYEQAGNELEALLAKELNAAGEQLRKCKLRFAELERKQKESLADREKQTRDMLFAGEKRDVLEKARADLNQFRTDQQRRIDAEKTRLEICQIRFNDAKAESKLEGLLANELTTAAEKLRECKLQLEEFRQQQQEVRRMEKTKLNELKSEHREVRQEATRKFDKFLEEQQYDLETEEMGVERCRIQFEIVAEKQRIIREQWEKLKRERVDPEQESLELERQTSDWHSEYKQRLKSEIKKARQELEECLERATSPADWLSCQREFQEKNSTDWSSRLRLWQAEAGLLQDGWERRTFPDVYNSWDSFVPNFNTSDTEGQWKRASSSYTYCILVPHSEKLLTFLLGKLVKLTTRAMEFEFLIVDMQGEIWKKPVYRREIRTED